MLIITRAEIRHLCCQNAVFPVNSLIFCLSVSKFGPALVKCSTNVQQLSAAQVLRFGLMKVLWNQVTKNKSCPGSCPHFKARTSACLLQICPFLYLVSKICITFATLSFLEAKSEECHPPIRKPKHVVWIFVWKPYPCAQYVCNERMQN